MKPSLAKKSKTNSKIRDLVNYLDRLNCISYAIQTDPKEEKIVYTKERKESPIYAKVKTARVAQLVEHDLAKVGVAGSNPVSRSLKMEEIEIVRPGGEMVDTQDLKSCNHCDCAGSSPAPGTNSERKAE